MNIEFFPILFATHFLCILHRIMRHDMRSVLILPGIIQKLSLYTVYRFMRHTVRNMFLRNYGNVSAS